MRCEVVAVGTELLLGQIVDTNSSWIGEQLALIGVDSHYQTKVGDNLERMVEVLETALGRSEAVIVCGGLGPTQDDITRDAIAAVMGVELVRDEALVEKIRSMFSRRGRKMPDNNLRQADVPAGASVNPVQPGTAPGLICPVGNEGKVVYAVPGVPWEMKQMLEGAVLPDLRERAGISSVIRSRVLRTWGQSESGLAEALDDEIRRLDESGEATIAFLASGWEGLKVRITAKAPDADEAAAVLEAEEIRVRDIIGDIVFGVDDDTMESVVLDLLTEQKLTLGLAESLTGGLIGARLTAVPGASSAFRGAVVPYDRQLKVDVLGTPDIPAVSEEMALAMAEGVCRVLDTDVGLAVTGVAGPEPLEGQEPGTVWIGLWLDGRGESAEMRWPFDRERTRQFTTISALNLLRTRLLERGD
jgi:nicotinamide-nucleotide amidase